MPLELRKWFQILTSVLGLVAGWTCWYYVSSALGSQASSARLALILLVLGAISGFGRLLTLFLPPVLTKIWPTLDS